MSGGGGGGIVGIATAPVKVNVGQGWIQSRKSPRDLVFFNFTGLFRQFQTHWISAHALQEVLDPPLKDIKSAEFYSAIPSTVFC